MAEILPFRAWRYSEMLMKKIVELTSPLFDVASEKQKAALYGNPHNSIHLSIPYGAYPAANAARILQQWREEGCIQHDSDPGVYVYYQYFSEKWIHFVLFLAFLILNFNSSLELGVIPSIGLFFGHSTQENLDDP